MHRLEIRRLPRQLPTAEAYPGGQPVRGAVRVDCSSPCLGHGTEAADLPVRGTLQSNPMDMAKTGTETPEIEEGFGFVAIRCQRNRPHSSAAARGGYNVVRQPVPRITRIVPAETSNHSKEESERPREGRRGIYTSVLIRKVVFRPEVEEHPCLCGSATLSGNVERAFLIAWLRREQVGESVCGMKTFFQWLKGYCFGNFGCTTTHRSSQGTQRGDEPQLPARRNCSKAPLTWRWTSSVWRMTKARPARQ